MKYKYIKVIMKIRIFITSAFVISSAFLVSFSTISSFNKKIIDGKAIEHKQIEGTHLSLAKIDKRIINSFTKNILNNIEFNSSIGTSREYILNFINDFVMHFWGIFYDF